MASHNTDYEGSQFAAEFEAALKTAVNHVCWQATPYGEDEEGMIVAYLIPAGALHLLVGAGQAVGWSTVLRASPSGRSEIPRPPDPERVYDGRPPLPSGKSGPEL